MKRPRKLPLRLCNAFVLVVVVWKVARAMFLGAKNPLVGRDDSSITLSAKSLGKKLALLNSRKIASDSDLCSLSNLCGGLSA